MASICLGLNVLNVYVVIDMTRDVNQSGQTFHINIITKPQNSSRAWVCWTEGLYTLKRHRLAVISILNKRWSLDRLKFIMGISIPKRPGLFRE